MIALIIGSLTLVITAQGASNVRRWGSRLQQAGQMDSKMSALYQFAQSVLTQSLPLSAQDKDGQRFTLFEGTAHEVRFVRAEPGYPSRAGLYQYHLYGAKSDGGWSLVLERELLGRPGAFGDMPAPVQLSLYDGPREPLFAFMGDGDWQDEWKRQDKAPILVRFAMGDWPALGIALSRPVQVPKKAGKGRAAVPPGTTPPPGTDTGRAKS